MKPPANQVVVPTSIAIVGYTTLVGPIIEEYLFRAGVHEILQTIVSSRLAVIGTGILFGIAHAPQMIADGVATQHILQVVAGMTGLGVVIGYAYARTRNLLVPMMIHAGYNTIVITHLVL